MGIEEMKSMKTQLMSCIQGQMGNLQKVDAKELGEAVDMVKDLSQAIYYCTITEAMEKSKEETPVNNINYYTMPSPNDGYYPKDIYQGEDMAGKRGRYLYYPTGNMGSSGNGGNTPGGNSGVNNYTMPQYMPTERDPREGRAGMRRRMYMEGKEMHKDINSQLKELETYLQELSSDITEMIRDASPEERATLHQKMTMLANKIS